MSKWDEFETYKGPDEENRGPRWWERLFIPLAALVVLGLIGAFGWTVAVFYFYRTEYGRDAAMEESMSDLYLRGGAGAGLAILVSVVWFVRVARKPFG